MNHFEEILRARVEKVASYYDQYKSIHAEVVLDRRTYLGNKQNRVCRFCGKNSSVVKFKKDAHAIPELLGNHYLCTYYECDRCNEVFSKLENDLGWFTELGRAITQLRGKKGTPTLKQGRSAIREQQGKLIIQDPIDEPILQWVGENELKITVKCKVFTPIAVYKAFTKMALSLMLEDELVHFKETLAWIKEEDHCAQKVPPLMAFKSFIPGPAFQNVGYKLFFRRDDVMSLVPYCQFVLKFYNFMYQIYIPFSIKDDEWRHGSKREVELLEYPPVVDLGFSYPFEINTDIINLSGCEKVRDNENSVTLEYSS